MPHPIFNVPFFMSFVMRHLLFFSIAACVLLLDQVTKILVIRLIPLYSSVPVTPFFSLTHVQNTGAAFGMFQNANVFFIVSTLIILVILGFAHRHIAEQGKWGVVGLGFLWGGALGNLADRLRLGCVTDFLDVYYKNFHWYTFNVADSAITVSICLMFLLSFTAKTESKER